MRLKETVCLIVRIRFHKKVFKHIFIMKVFTKNLNVCTLLLYWGGFIIFLKILQLNVSRSTFAWMNFSFTAIGSECLGLLMITCCSLFSNPSELQDTKRKLSISILIYRQQWEKVAIFSMINITITKKCSRYCHSRFFHYLKATTPPRWSWQKYYLMIETDWSRRAPKLWHQVSEILPVNLLFISNKIIEKSCIKKEKKK